LSKCFQTNNDITHVIYPNGKSLCWASFNNSTETVLNIWDDFVTVGTIKQFAWHGPSQLLGVLMVNTVHFFRTDFESRVCLSIGTFHVPGVRGLEWNPNYPNYIIALGGTRKIQLYCVEPTSVSCKAELDDDSIGIVTKCAWSSDGLTLVTIDSLGLFVTRQFSLDPKFEIKNEMFLVSIMVDFKHGTHIFFQVN